MREVRTIQGSRDDPERDASGARRRKWPGERSAPLGERSAAAL